MGERDKAGLTFNGAYSSGGGEGIIPSPAAFHKLPRRRNSSCHGPCCLLKLLLKLLVTVIVIGGIAIIVIWLVVKPTNPKFYAESVQFNNVTNNNTGDLALEMSVRNTNKKIGIYYDTLIASVYDGGNTIAFTTVGEFYQGHKNTTTLRPLFKSVYVSWNSEVNLRSRVRFKVWKVITKRYTLEVKCGPFSIPVNETTTAAFTRKKCNVNLDR